jgi:hypothetical protein
LVVAAADEEAGAVVVAAVVLVEAAGVRAAALVAAVCRAPRRPLAGLHRSVAGRDQAAVYLVPRAAESVRAEHVPAAESILAERGLVAE